MEQVQQHITKDMTIGDVVSKYPSVIEPLQAAGVHCVGCGVSYMETLEEGFKGHGMSDEEINSLLEQLNNSIKEEALMLQPHQTALSSSYLSFS